MTKQNKNTKGKSVSKIEQIPPGMNCSNHFTDGGWGYWLSIFGPGHKLSGGAYNFLLMAATIPTAPFHGYQVLFSPYSPHKLAFTGARNYGIAGEGAT